MTEAYDGQEVVWMDLHRRRSVLVRMTGDGQKLETARITNSPAELRRAIARAGTYPRVVLEATYGWYWAADTLAAAGAEVHLAHPLGVKGFSYRRVKNDERDAADLADLLRMGRLPEAWVAPHEVRELRELTRYRDGLVRIRTSCKDQVHAILAKLGIPVTCTDIFGVWGSAWLDGLGLAAVCGEDGLAAQDLRGADRRDRPAGSRDRGAGQGPPGLPGGPRAARHRRGDRGRDRRHHAVPASGRAVLVGWADSPPPRAGTKVSRGHITKQGSRNLRWALIEAIQHVPAGHPLRQRKDGIITRRGAQARNIAKVAMARQLLTWIFYAMRDGQVRFLAAAARQAA